MKRAPWLLLAAPLVAACGSSGSPGASSPAPSAMSSPPHASGVASGPFRLRIVTCGKLTSAQQGQFQTSSSLGVVVKAVNASNSLTAMPQATVEFLHGSAVDGTNDTPDDAQPIAPGQSGMLEADMGPSIGAGHAGDTCKITGYELFAGSSPSAVATYGTTS